MAVSSKIEELILEISKNVGNISDALDLGIGDINVPSSAIFEINNLRSVATTGYPYFGIVETDPLGFTVSYDSANDRYNVTIKGGTVSYDNSLIRLREQKIPIKREFLKDYSLEVSPSNFKYGITVGLSYDDISKTVQTFNTVTNGTSSAGSTILYVTSSAIADTLGYPVEAHVGSIYLKFSGSGLANTALFIDPSFWNGSAYGVLPSNVSNNTDVKFIYQPKLSYLAGFPVETEIQDPNYFKYFPPLPFNWIPVAKILVKQPNDPIVAGINTDAYLRTVIDMPTSTSNDPILGDTDDKSTVINQCTVAINELQAYKNNLPLLDFVNSISSFTNSLINVDDNTFNKVWSKQPFRPTQYYSKGVSFSGLERFEFPLNYTKAHYKATNYDPQHTFAIFRGDLVNYNSAVLTNNNISTTDISCTILTTNAQFTSLKPGTQIYGVSAVCGVDGDSYQETIPTYKSILSTSTTTGNYIVDVNFTGLGLTSQLFYHIYKRQLTNSETIEKRLTQNNQIIYEPVSTWSPVVENAYFTLSTKYTALKVNVNTNCFVGGFSIKLGFDEDNLVGLGSSSVNFAIYEDYDNNGIPDVTGLKTNVVNLPYNVISSGYNEFNLKFNEGFNAETTKNYWLVIEKLYDFETSDGVKNLKIRTNNSYSNNIKFTNSTFDGSESWSTTTGKAYFTLKGFIDDGNIKGYSYNRGIKLYNRIANTPRRLSVYVPNIDDLVDDTGLIFNGSGVAIASTTDKTIKNDLTVSVIAKNGENGTETTLTTNVPQGTNRDTRFLLGSSSDLFDRVVSVTVSPGSNLRRTQNGSILWDIYDLITVETEP